MKIQTIIQISALLILSSTQCMELEQFKINTNINQKTLTVDNFLLKKLIETSKKHKANPLLFIQRTKKLHLLQQLLNNNAEITFNSSNDEINFWLNKDETIVKNILHEQFLSFLSYRSDENIFTINHTPFYDRQNPFNLTMQHRTSLLHITSEQPLPYNAQTTATRFMNEYRPKTEIKKIITYNHLSENPQQPDQSLIPNQEITTIEDLTNINSKTLTVDNSLIQKLIETSKKNNFNQLLFSQRITKLSTLQELLNQNVNITFSNNNKSINHWLKKNKTIAFNILYEKLLSFLSYRPDKKIITINHTPFCLQKPFSITMQYSISLLHITTAEHLTHNTQKTLLKFVRGYRPNFVIETIIKKPSEKVEQQQQQPDQSLVANQKTTNIKDPLIQLTEDDYDLLLTLPHNTQELLRDILLDQDNIR